MIEGVQPCQPGEVRVGDVRPRVPDVQSASWRRRFWLRRSSYAAVSPVLFFPPCLCVNIRILAFLAHISVHSALHKYSIQHLVLGIPRSPLLSQGRGLLARWSSGLDASSPFSSRRVDILDRCPSGFGRLFSVYEDSNGHC